MSLFGALSASLTSLTAQSAAVNVISNNIANLSTTGFKSSSVSFSTLVTGDVGGGVLQSVRQDVDSQGAVESTSVGTDLAIQGNGFFVVQDASGSVKYTRAGSFRTDDTGNLVNEAGYILMGWELNSDGTVNKSNNNTSDLVAISTASIIGEPRPTTQITTKINLKKEEVVLRGAGQPIEFAAGANSSTNSSTIIVPNGFANNSAGTTFSVTPEGADEAISFVYGGIATSDDITAGTGIGGITSVSGTFNTAPFVDGAAFTIQAGTADAVTFTFDSESNPSLDQFRSLNELAEVINETDGLNARIYDGVLYIAADDANEALTFTDVSSSGLKAELGLVDITAAPGENRFATLQNLNDLINSRDDLAIRADLKNPNNSNANLTIYNLDPTIDIAYSSSDADLMTEFGLPATVAAVYDATNPEKNMAGGNIELKNGQNITVYDQSGAPVNLKMSFVKLQSDSDVQKWAVELYAPTAGDVLDDGVNGDGLVAYGVIEFNGDGTLVSVTGPADGKNIGDTFTVSPKSSPSMQLTINWGDAGTSNGISQFAGGYTLTELSQNGFPTGQLQSLEVDARGFVTANFDNSLSSQVYKLPVAVFSNPNALTQETGNAYSVNSDAGEVKLGEVGEAGIGLIIPGALEVSTAEIGTELTSLIVAQQAYSASSNVLRKITELFDKLENI